MFETVYHGVPIVTLPVFCDHDSNAAKAELDGYALKLELSKITAESLLWGIRKVIRDPKYKQEVQYRQLLLKDQKETPLEKAIYWTEYVLRHRGAAHMQSPAKDLNVFQYYLLDVLFVLFVSALCFYYTMKFVFKLLLTLFTSNVNLSIFKKSIKID